MLSYMLEVSTHVCVCARVYARVSMIRCVCLRVCVCAPCPPNQLKTVALPASAPPPISTSMAPTTTKAAAAAVEPMQHGEDHS